ncbi:putative zinc-binding dehydrogenase [Colletotrichum sublineola]|uniref:Dehydrogenase FUB6 n=1 Tax=Colletotrichum sublineola TaxID=1173701 RepID=A0A066X0P8_COLSU|nr:putative zinc-binding dehydrogenase [Colletotrichum sublineola]
MSTQNLSIVLAERPTAEIVPGQTFKTEQKPIPKAEDLKDGEILIENWYLSLDPAMRGWLNGTCPPPLIPCLDSAAAAVPVQVIAANEPRQDRRSYIPPVQIGEVMRGATVGRVLASKSPKAKEGDVLPAYGGWCEYSVVHDSRVEPVSSYPAVSQPVDYLSGIGMTALTAYFGMLRVGEPKAGETVVVSGAAGATGSVAGQIAKLKGARVVGIAGSDDKCRWLIEELGFDAALNYKDPEFKQKFKDATPNFIDVYFDNVGGEILDMALARAKEFSRFVMCGGISQYNSATPQGPKRCIHGKKGGKVLENQRSVLVAQVNYANIITMRIKMQGFIVFDYIKEYAQARKELAAWLEEGKIKRKETIIKGGLKVAEQALVDLYKGINTGKLIVEIKNPKDAAKL